MSGWICSYRAIWEHPIFKGDAERVGVWDWMLKTAAWKDTRFKVGGKIITLKRGQLCVSQRQVSAETGMTRQRFRTLLSELEVERAITQDATLGRSIITICKYDIYQSKETTENQGSNPAATQQQPNKEQGNNSDYVGREKSAPEDIRKILFDRGISLLTAAGDSDRTARSFLGSLRQSYRDADIIDAIGKAERNGAVEPKGFLRGCLRGAGKSGQAHDGVVDYGHFGSGEVVR